jgi:GGDEF domain-containing protein
LTRFNQFNSDDPFEDGILGLPGFSAATERALAHGESRAIVLIHLEAARLEVEAEHDLDDMWPVLLAAVEARTAGTIRPADLLGRLGDECLAVLTGEDGGESGADRVARRLAERLGEPFDVGGRELSLRPRIGVAHRDGLADTAEAMFRRAAQVAR